MSTESRLTEPELSSTRTSRRWIAGAGAGLVGGVGMGLILHFVMGAMPVVGSLYGQPTVLAGWIAHLVHSVVFALLFVGAITRTGLGRYARTTARTTGLGTAYGALLGVATGAFVLPLWVNAVSAAGMPVPFVSGPAFAGHVVFGLLLGAAFAVARGTAGTERATADEPTTDESTTDESDAESPTA